MSPGLPFKKKTAVETPAVETPTAVEAPAALTGEGADFGDESLTADDRAAIAEITAASEPSGQAEEDAPLLDDIKAWEQACMVGDENAPRFFTVPNAEKPPFTDFYFTWANQNPLNLKTKTGIGWRLVPPEVCKRLGLSPYQLDSRGFACVYDAVLMWIPRKPIDDYARRKYNEQIRDIRDIPQVQEFLEMGRSGIPGIRTFAGEAGEIQEEQRWRVNRPVRVAGFRRTPGSTRG